MAPFIILLFFLSEAASELIEVRVKTGRDATLPCRTAYPSIDAVEWRRVTPKPDILIIYKDKQKEDVSNEFMGRVDLVDRELTGRDVSLILKKVSRHDAGTYECRVQMAGSSRKKRAIITSEPIRTIRLLVVDSVSETVPPGRGVATDPSSSSGQGRKDEESSRVGLYVGLGALAALVGVVVVTAAAA